MIYIWQWLPCKVPTSTSGADLWFSILPKDALTCRPWESNSRPSNNKMLALPLSHSSLCSVFFIHVYADKAPLNWVFDNICEYVITIVSNSLFLAVRRLDWYKRMLRRITTSVFMIKITSVYCFLVSLLFCCESIHGWDTTGSSMQLCNTPLLHWQFVIVRNLSHLILTLLFIFVYSKHKLSIEAPYVLL